MFNPSDFENPFIRQLPDAGSIVTPEPLPDAQCIVVSEHAASQIGMDANACTHPVWTQLFSGAQPIAGFQPFAQVYAGHQFGGYVPRLGDGRGLLLGQIRNQQGELWDIHLKGAGQTPYSRQGDGRAVLRSCIREFLASEALYALGIPTSRALCVLTGNEPVYRETIEQRASLVRLAQTHIRFGHFEYFYYRNDIGLLRRLCDYCLTYHFPECAKHPSPLAAMLTEIVARTARMVAYWQAYGFCHGVMNTDNMSILGDTFDFGPFGFLDDYDASHICNHSDHTGRYAFAHQPDIAHWNLHCLAEALSPLLDSAAREQALATFEPELLRHYSTLMAGRFGLPNMVKGAGTHLNAFLTLLQQQRVDHTLAFVHLSSAIQGDPAALSALFSDVSSLQDWLQGYQALLNQHTSQGDALKQMQQYNPTLILRNYLAQHVIEAAEQGDYAPLNQLHQALKTPFTPYNPAHPWHQPSPEWGKRLSVSCSS